MAKKSSRRYVIFACQILSAGALILISRLIRRAVISNLKGQNSVSLIKNVISLKYAENTGAAFSAFSNSPKVLSAVTLIMLTGLLIFVFFYKTDSKAILVSETMILGGGFGNLIERISDGYVVDYIATDFIDFPIYNFSDILITLGAVLLFVKVIYDVIKGGGENDAS